MIDHIYLVSRLAIGFSCLVVSLHLILFYFKQQDIYVFKGQVFLWAGFIFLFGVNNTISFWVIPAWLTCSLYAVTGIVTTIAAILFPVSVTEFLRNKRKDAEAIQKDLDSFTYRMTLMRAAYKKEKDKRKLVESLAQELASIDDHNGTSTRLRTIISELLQLKEDILRSE